MKTDTDKIIGARLKSARMQKSMSQGKLGSHLGVTFQQIQKYEKGVNRLSVGTAARAASALGVSILSFLPDDVEMETGVCKVITDKSALRAAEIVSGLPDQTKIGAVRALEAIQDAVSVPSSASK